MSILNWREAYQEYAQALEKSVDELTRAERAQAALSAVLKTGDKAVARFRGIDHYMFNPQGEAMDIEHVHTGRFELGHIDVPFTVSQPTENTVVVEVGNPVDGTVFTEIVLEVSHAGEIQVQSASKGGSTTLTTIGNIITGRIGSLR